MTTLGANQIWFPGAVPAAIARPRIGRGTPYGREPSHGQWLKDRFEPREN